MAHRYEKHYDPSHPLADSSGQVYRHRANLFDAIGPGAHPCHVCGEPVDWFDNGSSKLVVDHLDDDPTNNAPSNLAPSHGPCNIRRARSWRSPNPDSPTLTDRTVVRHFLALGRRSAWVARLVGFSPSVVGRIKRGETYQRDLRPA